MAETTGRYGIPLASFALALLLASLGGPRASAFPLRAAGMATHDCTHEFSKERTPASCRGSETGPGGALVASDCVDRAPTDQPGVRREIRLVRSVELDTKDAGNFIDESEANTIAGARDAGVVLGLSGSHSVSKYLRIKDSEPCCHALASGVRGNVSTSIHIEVPTTIGRAGVGVASAVVRVRIDADCAPGITAEQEVQVETFAILLRGPLGNEAGFAQIVATVDGAVTQVLTPRFPNPALGGVASHAEPFSLLQPDGAKFANEASGTFEGSHTVRVLAAPGADSTTTARGRSRLTFIDHLDDNDADEVGELEPD